MTKGLLKGEKKEKTHPHVFLGSEKHTYENPVTLLNRIQFFMLKNLNAVNEVKIATKTFFTVGCSVHILTVAFL